MKAQVEYLPDDCVNDSLDLEIRGLLTACFTQPEAAVFQHRRYASEPYSHRWVIRDELGAIIAHIGVHDRKIETREATFRVGGICEVCVHPDPSHRGNGYVRLMLGCVHDWLLDRGYVFSVLFGKPQVYGSSGYTRASDLLFGGDELGWHQSGALVKELSDTPWPSAQVKMPGPKF